MKQSGLPTRIETANKLKGRPRKKEGTIELSQFARVGLVLSAYEEARERGEKHSIAVAHTVQSVKQDNPRIHISNAEVRRILATWRPRSCNSIIRFERSPMTEGDLEMHRWVQSEIATLAQTEGLVLPPPRNLYGAPNPMKLTMRRAERRNYPRHNRKDL